MVNETAPFLFISLKVNPHLSLRQPDSLKKKRRPPLKKSMPREEEENARHKLTMILKRVKRRGNDIDMVVELVFICSQLCYLFYLEDGTE